MKASHRLVLCVAVMASCISCDQVTKSAARALLESKPAVSCLNGAVVLTYAENPGGFLGAGAFLPAAARYLLFLPVTAALVIGLVTLLIRTGSLSPVRTVSLSLIAAGGVGNLMDRLASGTVRDFISVGVGPLRTGIFNVADVAIMMGAALLLATGVRRDRH